MEAVYFPASCNKNNCSVPSWEIPHCGRRLEGKGPRGGGWRGALGGASPPHASMPRGRAMELGGEKHVHLPGSANPAQSPLWMAWQYHLWKPWNLVLGGPIAQLLPSHGRENEKGLERRRASLLWRWGPLAGAVNGVMSRGFRAEVKGEAIGP